MISFSCMAFTTTYGGEGDATTFGGYNKVTQREVIGSRGCCGLELPSIRASLQTKLSEVAAQTMLAAGVG